MARDRDGNRTPEDVGSDSPASEQAKEQTRTGAQGAARGSGEKGGTDRQPPQGSGRSGGGPEARARKHFEDDEAPDQQENGTRSPEAIKADPKIQGSKGRGHAGPARPERGEDEATTHEK